MQRTNGVWTGQRRPDLSLIRPHDEHAQSAFISRVSEVLAGSLNYEQTHDRLLDLVVPTLADMCSIHLLDAQGRFQRIAARYSSEATATVGQGLGDVYLDDGEPDGPMHDLLAGGESLLWTPGADDSGAGDLLDRVIGAHRRPSIEAIVDLTSILFVPLIAHGQPLGWLALATVAPRLPTGEHERAMADALARQAALALDSARLYREATTARLKAERAQARLAFLAEASKTLAGSLDTQATLQTVVTLAVPTLADCCGVGMVDEADTIQRTAVAHVDAGLQRRILEHGLHLPLTDHPHHPIRRALRTGEPVLLQGLTSADLRAFGDSAYFDLLVALRLHSVLVVPLEARGRRFGAMTLVLSDPARIFDDADVALAVEVAGRAALAIDNARLFCEVSNAKDGLQQQFELSDAIVRNIAEGIIVVDGSSRITYVNPVAEQLLNCPSDQLVGRNAHDAMHVKDRSGAPMPLIECALQAVPTTGTTLRLENELFMRADGSTFPVSIVTSPLVHKGNMVGAVTVFRDIEEDLRQREALRESEERLQRALRSAGMVMWERDFRSGRTVRSALASELYGRQPGDLLADSEDHLRLVHPEDRVRVATTVSAAISEGTGYELEYRVLWPDGSVRWLSGRARVFHDEHGQPCGISGTTHDVTARKAAELERNQLLAEREAEAEALRALHARLEASLDALLGLHEVGKLLVSVSDPDAMAKRLLEIAVHAAGLRAAVLRRIVDESSHTLWQCAGDEAAIAAARSVIAATNVAGSEARLHAWTECVEASEDGQPPLIVWSVPLIVRGEVIGVLAGVGDPRPRGHPTLAILGSIALQAATAIENARLYREVAEREQALHLLVQTLMQAQDDERRRLANEIHDGFAQLVYGLQQLLEAFAHAIPLHPDDARHRINVAIELAQRVIQEIRRVLAGLRPTVLDDFGLARGLRAYVDGLQAEGFEVTYVETMGALRLPADLEITLFRVAQEALANVRKHAGVQTAELRLTRGDGEVVLEVLDQGRGFDGGAGQPTGQPGAQLGLLGMRERIAHVGGKLEITSRRGAGTQVRAAVPLPSLAPGVFQWGAADD